MDQHDKKPAPFARELGFDDSFIRDILRGKKKRPAADALASIADALQTTSDYLMGRDKDGELAPLTIVRSGDPVKFAGIAQAGVWSAVQDDYFSQDPEAVPSYVLPDPAFSRVRQYAWRALGNSMDQAGIHDGMWVVGADAADYIDTYGDIKTGDLVVAERTRYQGQERELTVKEIHYFRDRYELHPMSSDPSFKPIVVPHDHSADGDHEEVRIIGVVLTAYANLRKRR